MTTKDCTLNSSSTDVSSKAGYGQIETPQYQGRGGIEPIDFIVTNNMDFLEGNIIKYIYRYPFKGKLKALRKAQDYLRMLIERERAMELDDRR